MIIAPQLKTSDKIELFLYKYVLPGDPIPLMRPRIKGRTCYDSQHQIRLVKGIGLRNQHGEKPEFTSGLLMTVIFYMPLPASWSPRKKESMIGRHHISRPDLSNLLKFVEDLAVDVHILKDDCLIAEVIGRKLYDENPRTEFVFTAIE